MILGWIMVGSGLAMIIVFFGVSIFVMAKVYIKRRRDGH